MRDTGEIVEQYRAQPGAEQIGSAYAAEGLRRWLERARPERVLEVGGGIGCLTAVLVETLGSSRVVTVEDDAWCRAEWGRHLGARAPRLLGSDEVSTVPRVDFLVVDGGDRRTAYYEALARHAVVFVEGNRRDQRAVLERFWEGIRPYAWASWKPRDRSKGYWVYQFEPTPCEDVRFALVRARERLRDRWAGWRGRPVGKRAR